MIVRILLSRFRGTLLASVGLSFASAATTLLLLTSINDLVNGMHVADARLLLAGLELLTLLFFLNLASQLLLAQFGGNLVTQTRSELARRLLELEYQQLLNNRSFVFASLIEDVARIVPLVLMVPQLTYNLLLVGVFSVYLFNISAQLAGVLAVFLTVTLSVSFAIGKALRSRFDVARRSEEAVFECFRSISEGKREMSLSNTRKRHFSEQVFDPALQRARSAMQRAQVLGGAHTAWWMTVLYGAIFAVAYVGYDQFNLPLNTVAHFVVATLFLTNPIALLTQSMHQLAPGMASLRHLASIGLDMDAAIESLPVRRAGAPERSAGWHQIRAVTLRYRFPAQGGLAYELGPVDLEISRGEMVFLTGGNGSGKSTLLLLLCGLLRPCSGQLLVDGQPVIDDLARYRDRFAGTFSDAFLFQHVLDGAGRCLPDAEIETHLQWLGLSDSVKTTDGEVSRLSLSTGQRKRLALLQCYAEDRDIIFFDEWAADQDAHFREYFYYAVLPRLKQEGKTLIVISHDDRYFNVADRVVKLEGGRIVEDRAGRTGPATAAPRYVGDSH